MVKTNKSQLLKMVLLAIVGAVLIGAVSAEGATGVTYVVAAPDSVNPRADYICTNTYDTCIQDAINAVTGIGGKIALLDGTYNISSPITISKNSITMVGAGRLGTRLLVQNSMTSVINITGNRVTLENFGITVTENYSIDSAVKITGKRTKLSDFVIMVQNAAPVNYGVITQGSYTKLSNVRMEGFVKGGIKFDGPTATGYDDKLLGGMVENSQFINSVGYSNDSGVEIYGAAARITIKNNIFEELDNAVYAHEVGVREEDIIIDGNNFMYSKLHFCENGNGDITAPLRTVIITNNHVYDGTLLFDAEVDNKTEWRTIIANNTIYRKSNKSDTVINLEYGGGMITGNLINLGGVTELDEPGGTGLLIGQEGSNIIGNIFNSGATRIKLIGGVSNIVISGNKFLYMGYCVKDDQGNVIGCNDTIGIHLKEKVREWDSKVVGPYNVTISGNVFGIGLSTGHYSGIVLDPHSQWNLITDNIFDWVDPATLIDPQGTNNTIRNNKGFVTENAGTAVIVSGSNSITVSHGLDITPSISNINVAPTNNMGNASKFWVSNVTATTFDINVDNDPGTGGAEFSWQITSY
ncbi:MAG: hypothetical protein GXP46_04940 [Deferribacteres bacterium]|nr:hypothetical protein [Deferribacteres bacterium]